MVDPAPAPAATTLGPDGYGKLKLGMTKERALATGELGADDPNDPLTCAWYGLADLKRDDRGADWTVAISKELESRSVRPSTG